ncbi:putative LRR receptor-like serine/threonine-protein kinase [Abeliophyllum distichum]|uniref:LRR receptor-like serine/threonine-protein kinase n=1 Tax=Abeliophyllum distichum TaxID=126358 RepID=A0ABD1PN49_9LAMI
MNDIKQGLSKEYQLDRSSLHLIQPLTAVSLATGKTNPNDGLNALRKGYLWLWPSWELVHEEDPCLPQTWSGIECNSDTNPRVIALYLRGKGLLAPLPDFSSMDALETIDLQGNGLSGAIPSFLSKFPKLQVLLAGNTDLYTSSTCTTSKSESPPTRTNPDTPSGGTFGFPGSNPGTPSGGSGTFGFPGSNPVTPSAGTFESPSTNTDTASGGSFEFPGVNPKKKKKNKFSIILGSTGSGIAISWITGAIFAIFRLRANAAAAAAAAIAEAA